MKSLWMRTARCARRYPFVQSASALLLAILLHAPAPVQARTTPTTDSPAVTHASDFPGFSATVFPVYRTTKCKVIFTRGNAACVTIRLKNEAGQVLFTQVVTEPTYLRQFDLSKLPNARYYFELETLRERYVKEIWLEAKASRTLIVH